MKDVSYIAAFPKSGITYLNFMLFHILFDRPQDVRLIDSDYANYAEKTLPPFKVINASDPLEGCR